MKIDYMNEGQPLQKGHPHAGKIGVMIDHEDGITEPHRVYAYTEREMNIKLATMYANTQKRIAEVKQENLSLKSQPTTPTPAPAQLSPEQKMQLTTEITDPARSGKAIVELLKAEGVDVEAPKREAEADAARKAELARLDRETKAFAANNPEYKPGPWGRVISDRAFAKYGTITAETLQQSFEALREEGVLPSAALEQTHSPEPSAEPSAQPSPIPPRGTSTSYRPSQLGSGPRGETTQTLTYEAVLELASTPEYERRMREEPGFAAKVDKAYADFERGITRRAG